MNWKKVKMVYTFDDRTLADLEGERGLARILCAVRKVVINEFNEKKGTENEMKW